MSFSIYDTNEKFNDLAKELIEKVVKNKFYLENPRESGHFLTLENIIMEDPKNTSSKAYIDTKNKNGSMIIKIFADIIEVDSDKNKIKTVKEKVLLGSIPYRTQFGTYMLNNDYSIVNQLRNKPGVYSSVSSSGDVNSAFQFSKGRSFKIVLSPKSKKIAMSVGMESVPLRPLLRIFGFNDYDLQETYGDYLRYNEKEDWNAFYEKMKKNFFSHDSSFNSLSLDKKNAKIKKYFSEDVELDSDNTEILTGINTKTVTESLLKKVIQKTIAINKREIPEDDRDDLLHNKLMTPSHLFADRLDKQLPTLLNKAKHKLKYGKEPESVFKNILSKPLHNTVKSSDLSRLDPQYNILGANLTGRTITMLGEGAISSSSSVKEKTRAFHMSHTGLLDPTFTPQGMSIGVNLRASPALKVKPNGDMTFKLFNVTSKRTEELSLLESRKVFVLLPGEKMGNGKKVKALHNNEVVEVADKKITHTLNESIFADSLQIVPFMSGMQGPRGIMGATQMVQAVPLINREAAFVIPKNPGSQKAGDEVVGKDYLNNLGLLSPVSGTIKSINKELIVIKGDDGKEYNIETKEVIPLQYNTGIEVKPNLKFKEGDKVKKGDPLFLTNFHDEKGRLALGTHLKVMYASDPRGYGVEDGIVISESAAAKLKSEHFYKVTVDVGPMEELSFKKVETFFRHKYNRDKLSKIDEATGIVKPNSILKFGDVVACKITEHTPNETEMILGQVSRSLGANFKDASITWDHFHDGEVKEIISQGKNYIIVVKTEEDATVGSKVTGRFGNKGVVAAVLPDDEMPRTTSDQKSVDIILSAASVPSRVNPNQILEASLGKVAKKTGKRYEVDEFDSDRNVFDFTDKELAKANIKDTETVFDPYTGSKNEMFIGNEYFLKLFSPEKDISARGVMGAYDSNLQPTKGGKEGSKGFGLMEFYAMLGNNAPNMMKEFGTIKSEKNLDFWRKFEVGLANMPKNTPYTFDKFSSILTSAGARIQRTPEGIKLVPVTDADTEELSKGRQIKNDMTIRGTDYKVIKDGLFDISLTGGLEGKLWSHYEMADSIPHPLLRDIIRVVLGKDKDSFREYVKTKKGSEMKRDLDDLKLEDVKKRIKEDIQNKVQVSANVAALRFISNLEKAGDKKLSDFIISKIPILPPKYRPIIQMQDGSQTISDLNYLYKDLISADKLLRESSDIPEIRQEAKEALVNSVDSFLGLEDPQSKALAEKGVKGALTYITGKTSPKEGFFLSKMMKRQQVVTGRSRIIPDPNLSMDQVGIPDFVAWNMYEPHLRKELRSQGFEADEVSDMIEKKTDRARASLNKVLEENYVLVNRAPTLHRFSILSAKPKIVKGDNITLNNFFESPLNADYDGDAVTLFAPVTAQAKKEAEGMLLSKNPFTGYSPEDLVTSLDSEAIFGLYKQSRDHKKEFDAWWKENIPQGITYSAPIDKKQIKKIMREVAKKHPNKFADVFQKMNRDGIRWSYTNGLTVSMKDIKPRLKETKSIINKYKERIETEKDAKVQGKLASEMEKELTTLALGTESNLADLVKSGAKAKPNQLANILSSVGLLVDPRSKKLKVVEANTSKGYDFATFLPMNALGRDNLIKTKLNVAAPGDLGKQIAFNLKQEHISEHDCGTKRYISVEPNNEDLVGRVLAVDQAGLKKHTVITTENISNLSSLDKVKVRSPLTCEAKQAGGVCQLCWGADDFGNLEEMGHNIGIKATNSFSMSLSQKALDSKHSGRSIGESLNKTSFESAKELLQGTVKGEAVVSTVAGEVTGVEEQDDGSFIIRVDKKKFKVPYPLKPEVRIGEPVDIGTVLSTGEINSKSIGNSMGLGHARNFFTKALHDQILEANGMGTHERNVELVAKALYKFVKVEQPFEDHLPGDVVTINEIKDDIQKNSSEKNIDDIKIGDRLGDFYLEYQPLDAVSNSVKEKLKAEGFNKVFIFNHPEKVIPIAKGTSTLPLLSDDKWLENMGFRYLKKNIGQALASGRTQSLNTKENPISSYVMNLDDA